MKQGDLTKMVKNTKVFLVKHRPEILTGLGIAGMVTTTVLAVKSTPKALELLGKAECEKGEELTAAEVVKACWKVYIPAAVTGTASIACIIGANSISARRTAALTAAYQISETALSEYRDKVIETIGEKKEQAVRDKVAEQKVKDNPASQTTIVTTEKGNTLCFDPLSSRYFKSDIELIKKAENNLNKQLLHGISGRVSLNDFYDELNIPRTELGYEMGWNTDGLIDLDISSTISDDGIPCIVVGHYKPPTYDYFIY